MVLNTCFVDFDIFDQMKKCPACKNTILLLIKNVQTHGEIKSGF